MKKVFAVIVCLMFVAGVSMTSFAAKEKDQKYDKILAKVVSVDVAAKTMVVTEEKTGATRTIKISAKAAPQINAGDRVRIKLKPGTDESLGVRVLKDHSKDGAAATPAETPQVEPAAAAPAAPAAPAAAPEKK